MKVAHLQISSWRGISIGANHFYGSLWCGVVRKEIKKRMTAAEARALNAKDGFATYSVGMTSERFDSRDEVIATALATYRTIFPDAEILMLQSWGIHDPRDVLDGPAPFMVAANKIVKRADAVGGWDRPEKMQPLCEAWDKLLEKYVVER